MEKRKDGGMSLYGPPEFNDLFLRYQEPEEIFPALAYLKERQPKAYLEIGSAAGISLHLAMEAFGKDCRYRAVDILERPNDNKRLLDLIEAYNVHGYDVALIHGRSDKSDSINAARDAGPYDVIMVDADHSFRAALGDIVNYAPLLTDTGALVMHDADPLGILDGITKRKVELPDCRHIWMAAKAFLPKGALREFITPGSRFGSKKGIGIIEAWALRR